MFGSKTEGKIILREDGNCKVRGSALDVAKMYLACRRTLMRLGCDLEKLNELQAAAIITDEKTVAVHE